jgi:hypothetical protein
VTITNSVCCPTECNEKTNAIRLLTKHDHAMVSSEQLRAPRAPQTPTSHSSSFAFPPPSSAQSQRNAQYNGHAAVTLQFSMLRYRTSSREYSYSVGPSHILDLKEFSMLRYIFDLKEFSMLHHRTSAGEHSYSVGPMSHFTSEGIFHVTLSNVI